MYALLPFAYPSSGARHRYAVGRLPLHGEEAESRLREIEEARERELRDEMPVHREKCGTELPIYLLHEEGDPQWCPELESLVEQVRDMAVQRTFHPLLVSDETAILLSDRVHHAKERFATPDFLRWNGWDESGRTWATPNLAPVHLMRALAVQIPPEEHLALWRRVARPFPRAALAWTVPLATLFGHRELLAPPPLAREDFLPLLGAERSEIRLAAMTRMGEMFGRDDPEEDSPAPKGLHPGFR